MNQSAQTTRESILEEIKNAILKDRQTTYGPPEDSFAIIADLWTVYMSRHKPGPLLPHDVAALMALMKIARIMLNPYHPDSWVDAGGYSICGGELAAFQQRLMNGASAAAGPVTPVEDLPIQKYYNYAVQLWGLEAMKHDPQAGNLITEAMMRPESLTALQKQRILQLAALHL